VRIEGPAGHAHGKVTVLAVVIVDTVSIRPTIDDSSNGRICFTDPHYGPRQASAIKGRLSRSHRIDAPGKYRVPLPAVERQTASRQPARRAFMSATATNNHGALANCCALT
jgi:hypothetical protein